jgi:hypothetical protein
MGNRIQVFSIIAAVLLVVLVIELVRRRRLSERYALLWLLSAFVILGLAIWQGLLEKLARVTGIAYPPNALFLVALAFVLLLLLNFSAALSRLQDQTRILAQRLAIIEASDENPRPESEALPTVKSAKGPVGEDDPPARA